MSGEVGVNSEEGSPAQSNTLPQAVETKRDEAAHRRPFSVWRLFTGPLEGLGRWQLGFTSWPFLRPVGAFVYLGWYLLLSAVPGWLGWGGGMEIGWGLMVLFLGLGLVLVYFSRDAEQRAAIRGLLEGQGNYLTATPFGQLSDPLLDIRERYPQRLRFGTLLAGGAGMVLGFARLCQGMEGIPRIAGWFDVPEGVDPGEFGPWVWYAVLHVFRALDIFDTSHIAGTEGRSLAGQPGISSSWRP